MTCELYERNDGVLMCANCDLEIANGIPWKCGKLTSLTLAQRAYEMDQCLSPSGSELWLERHKKEVERIEEERKGKFESMEKWLRQKNTEESNFALEFIHELIEYNR